MSGRPVSREQLRKIRDHRVKLCQSALLKDGNTACYFSGIMEDVDTGDEYAVSLGKNGHAVVCGITIGKMILFGKTHKHTTLLHLLCQSRMHLLIFLLKRYHKKSRSLSNGLSQSSLDERYDVVASYIINNFPDLAYVTDEGGKTPLDSLIQHFGDSGECLHSWHDVYKSLVDKGVADGERTNSHFIKAILQKISQIKLLPRKCGDSCACVKNLFLTLWYTDRATVESHSFLSAATNGNFGIMQLLLRVETRHSVPPFVTTEIPSPKTGSTEPLIVLLIKLTSQQGKDCEDDVLEIIRLLVNRDDVDINKADTDGLNAVFYSALYKKRKIFHFLLHHEKYKADWRNGSNESLEDLFNWSDIATSNPAALIAVRSAAYKAGIVTKPKYFPLTSSSSEWTSRPEQPDSPKTTDIDYENFKKKILDHFPRLCDDMEPDGKCLDILIQRGVFPWNKIDGLMHEKTRHNKARRVLTLVLRSGKKGRSALLEALRQSDQDHLVSLLSFERSSSYQSLSPNDSSSRLEHETSIEGSTLPRSLSVNLPAAHELSFEQCTYNTSFTAFVEGNPVRSWNVSPEPPPDDRKSPEPSTVVSV